MKKNYLLLAALIFTLFAHAKDYTLVVKSTRPTQKGKSEVHVDETTNDTITITPAADVTTIQVRITDATGEVINAQVLPANTQSTNNIEAPELPDGHMIEIRDDHGVIYSDITL